MYEYRLASIGGEKPGPDQSLFMDLYAAQARVHMDRFGTTQEDFARVASNTHCHGQYNPNAQYRTPFTVEQVLADKSIVYLFTRAICAPVSDGSPALVLCSEKALKRISGSRAVRLRSIALLSTITRDKFDYAKHISRRGAHAAYQEAAVDPKDIDVVEVHDATAFSTVQQIENLGLCEPGEVGACLTNGDFKIGDRAPVNPSGGLLAKGHPVGATSIAQIYELVTQLRGAAGLRQVEGARMGIAEFGGGFLGVEEGVTTVAIMEKYDPLQVLERWVEQGEAPEHFVAEQHNEQGDEVRSRPVCAYPQVAELQAGGDPNKAGSYQCAVPEK